MLADYEIWERQHYYDERSVIWCAVVAIMKEKGTFIDVFPPRAPIDILLEEIRKSR